MKVPHIIILLVIALLIFSLAIPIDQSNQAIKNSNQVVCPLTLQNTSASTIWITTHQTLGDQVTEEELKQVGATAIVAHDSKRIGGGTWFSIYTRAPVTNDVYNRKYTFIQRDCKKRHENFTISMDAIEQKKYNAKKIIVIDHEEESPENNSLLCPDGKNPVLDTIQEQWFCMQERDGQTYFVPVYSYIYQWIPSFIISQWYIDHPIYYHWYHEHPEFWQHLKNYTPVWQSPWYKQWYQKAPESEIEYLRDPEEQDDITLEHEVISREPFGLPADEVKARQE